MKLRGQKLLISTPIFHGDVATQYFASLLGLLPFLVREGVEFQIFTEARNLIHQARSRAAHFAINNKFDKLLFIDSDISFKPEHVLALLASDKKLVGGLYPFKTFPLKLNFVPMQGIYDTPQFEILDYVERFADKTTGEIEVHMLPTGFMCIDVSLFKEIEPFTQKYNHKDQFMDKLEHENLYFPFKIADDGFLYTEDWGFCDLVRTHTSHRPFWNTNVIVDHVGSYCFSATLPQELSYKPVDIHTPQIAEEKKSNPFAKWPRNLACFCGSGQKFKRCHENKLDPSIKVSEYEVLKPEFDRVLDHVQKSADQGVGYKLQKPLL